MTTIGEVLAEIKKQLDWRGPSDKAQGIITMPREHAEYLHRWAIDLCNAKDDLEMRVERLEKTVLLKRLAPYVSEDDVDLGYVAFLQMVADRINDDIATLQMVADRINDDVATVREKWEK